MQFTGSIRSPPGHLYFAFTSVIFSRATFYQIRQFSNFPYAATPIKYTARSHNYPAYFPVLTSLRNRQKRLVEQVTSVWVKS